MTPNKFRNEVVRLRAHQRHSEERVRRGGRPFEASATHSLIEFCAHLAHDFDRLERERRESREKPRTPHASLNEITSTEVHVTCAWIKKQTKRLIREVADLQKSADHQYRISAARRDRGERMACAGIAHRRARLVLRFCELMQGFDVMPACAQVAISLLNVRLLKSSADDLGAELLCLGFDE